MILPQMWNSSQCWCDNFSVNSSDGRSALRLCSICSMTRKSKSRRRCGWQKTPTTSKSREVLSGCNMTSVSKHNPTFFFFFWQCRGWWFVPQCTSPPPPLCLLLSDKPPPEPLALCFSLWPVVTSLCVISQFVCSDSSLLGVLQKRRQRQRRRRRSASTKRRR